MPDMTIPTDAYKTGNMRKIFRYVVNMPELPTPKLTFLHHLHHQNRDRFDNPRPPYFRLRRCRRKNRSEVYAELRIPRLHQRTSASTPRLCH